MKGFAERGAFVAASGKCSRRHCPGGCLQAAGQFCVNRASAFFSSKYLLIEIEEL